MKGLNAREVEYLIEDDDLGRPLAFSLLFVDWAEEQREQQYAALGDALGRDWQNKLVVWLRGGDAVEESDDVRATPGGNGLPCLAGHKHICPPVCAWNYLAENALTMIGRVE